MFVLLKKVEQGSVTICPVSRLIARLVNSVDVDLLFILRVKPLRLVRR